MPEVAQSDGIRNVDAEHGRELVFIQWSFQ